VLDVDVLAYGSSLNIGQPRLKVGVNPDAYEGNLVWSAILAFGMGVLVLVGAILLVVSFIKKRRGRSSLSNA